MGIFNKNIIHEVYFGKNKEILELEKILSDLRKEINKNDIGFKKTGNSSENLFKFNRKCEDMFGFKTFALNIIYSPSINAFTIPVHMNFDVWDTSKNFVPTKNNMKYSKEAEYCCTTWIYSELLLD